MTIESERLERWLQDIAASARAGDRIQPWTGTEWRCHSRRFAEDDAGGSRIRSGRFHRAPDHFAGDETWQALYTACSSAIALGEVVRNSDASNPTTFSALRMSQLNIELHRVLVAHAPLVDAVDSLLGLDFRQQCAGYDYHATQEFVRLAREVAEAILVPSCTRLPEGNLVIFPDRLDPSSTISIANSTDLSLTKD